MPAATDEPTSTAAMMMMIDENYKFSAPRFFDFTTEESDGDKNKAELWFDSARPYAPTPFRLKMLEALQDIEIASRLVGFDGDTDDSR